MISTTGITRPKGTIAKSTDAGTPVMGTDVSNIYKFIKLDTDGNIIISNTSGSTNLRVLVDQVSTSLSYVGYAIYDALTNQSKWLIFRLEVLGTVTNKSFANTSTEYDKIWNDRATYTYL
jgi:hypothetical protein